MIHNITNVIAEENKQELFITREFDFPIEFLFQAFEDKDLLEQWMGTKVVKLENKKYGSYEFQTFHNDILVFNAQGVFHEFQKNARIIRTFEMMNTGFPPELEFLEFKSLGDEKSLFTQHIIFKSIEWRNELLKMPFSEGINMAHNRLQKLIINIFGK